MGVNILWEEMSHGGNPIREIPDHATFREKEHSLGWLDKLGGFYGIFCFFLT